MTPDTTNNPTNNDARITVDASAQNGRAKPLAHNVGSQKWIIHFNPRAHRKQRRHTLFLNDEQQYPPVDSRHWFTLEWTNISWWVAFLFTLGSLVWLVNGTLCMWPLACSALQSSMSAWTAFAGGFIFLFGGYAALLEVFNRPTHIAIDVHPESASSHPVYHAVSYKDPMRLIWLRFEPGVWSWWMNMIQMAGALTFLISCAAGVVALDHPHMPMFTWYWMPQIVGSLCFVIASIMAMLEVQNKWTHPGLRDMGWYSGLFNLIGAFGFLLCACFGAYSHTHSDVYWGSDFSTFWGSIGFLIASYIMWYEAINK